MSPLPAGIWQKLCISASNLRHAPINGTFSVLFKKRCRSVSSVISGSLFVCLFLYRFKKVHFRRGFSKVVINTHWSYRGVGSVLSPLLKRPKTESFCKLIKYAPILDTLQHRWATRKKNKTFIFASSFQLHKHYSAFRITRWQTEAHNLLLSLWISSRPKIAVRTLTLTLSGNMIVDFIAKRVKS